MTSPDPACPADGTAQAATDARTGLWVGRRAASIGGLLALCGCSPADILNRLAANRLAESGLAYGPHPRQQLDLYRPAGPGPHPVLVFLYGGRWQEGTRALYRFVGGSFAARGYVVVIPDYRLYPEVSFPVFLQDCARAVAWARREAVHHGGDGAPPWLIGHSAGAYNMAMLTLAPSYLAAVGLSPARDLRGAIGLAGPYDFLPLEDETLKTLFHAPPSGFADPSTQPISFADGANPPMLLLAGAADTTVRPANTLRLAARIRARGGRAIERIYPGIDHVEIVGALSPLLRLLAPTLRDCLAFLRDTA